MHEDSAESLLSWLHHHPLDERALRLECLVLVWVPLKTAGPKAYVREILSHEGIARWIGEWQVFSDLQNFLRSRHEGGGPVKLVLRGGNYDSHVIKSLRPFARHLEVEPASQQSWFSKRAADLWGRFAQQT